MGTFQHFNYLNSTGFVNCPECASSLKVYDYSNSTHFGCPNCKTFFNSKHQIKGFKVKDFGTTPAIPIGSSGTFFGKNYTVAAFIVKKEKGNNYTWREYLLINEQFGYAFLSEYDGHWNFIAGKHHYPDLIPIRSGTFEVNYNGNDFRLYNVYQPQVIYAIGEFDWDITNEFVNASEYICPPKMLVKEQIDKHIDWYLASYFYPREIADAFGLKKSDMPEKWGVGANQPSPFTRQSSGLKMVTSIAIILMIAISFITGSYKPLKKVFSESYLPQRDTSSWVGGNSYKTITSGSFTIEGPTALSVQLKSNVSNEWMEVPVTLINDKTGKFYEFTKAIEYYSGYEDGESWSEGSKEQEALLSNLPSGTYHLSIEPTSDSRGGENLEVTIYQNPSLWSNFFIILLIIIIYPAIQLIRSYLFDKNRWMNSDYSPYDQESSF